MGPGVDQLVWQLDLSGIGGRLEDRLLELPLDRVLIGLTEPLGDVVAQLGERVEAASLEGELVVEVGQALLAHLLDRRLEGRLLAGQLLGPVLVREVDFQLAVLARRRPEQLVLEARDEPARAELDRLAAALAALERLVVEEAGVVEHHEVAVLRLALNRLE